MVAHSLEISTLNETEQIGLRSTLHAMDNQNFICSTCLGQYANMPGGESRTKMNRRYKACETIEDRVVHQIVQDGMLLSYNTCIGNFFSTGAVMWVEAFRKFDKGIMPYQGGYMEQPNKAIDIFRIIESDHLRRADKQRKKQALNQTAKLRSVKSGKRS